MALLLMNEKKPIAERMIVMNDELFEIFELVEKVVSGDNKTAKDALRKFVMVASLIEDQKNNQVKSEIIFLSFKKT